jgi:hypothetical protein
LPRHLLAVCLRAICLLPVSLLATLPRRLLGTLPLRLTVGLAVGLALASLTVGRHAGSRLTVRRRARVVATPVNLLAAPAAGRTPAARASAFGA